MKRLAFGVAIALAVSSAAQAATLYPRSADGLNLRQGPGTQYPVLAVLAPGQGVPVLGRQGDWYQVRLGDGRTAWAAAAVARVVYDRPLPGEVTAAGGLNLRRGPGTQHPVAGVLPLGTRVSVLETGGDWHRVRTAAGQEGWVAAAYIRIGQPVPPPAAGFTVSLEKAVSLAVGEARLRRGNEPGYDPVDTVRAGDRLEYLESAAGWVRVTSPRDVRGWLEGRLVALWDRNTPFDRAPVYRLESGSWRIEFAPARTVSSADGLWLRTGPSTGHGRIALMPRGTVLKVLRQEGDWIQVLLSDGRTGWCYRPYTAAMDRPVPRVESVSLTETAPGVTVLEITGRLEGAAIQPLDNVQGLLFAVPDAAAPAAHLEVAAAAVRDLAVAAPGVQIRFTSSPAYRVLEHSAGRIRVEFRPALVGAERVEEEGRTLFRFRTAGAVVPRVRPEGDELVLDLGGALLQAPSLPAGLTAGPAGEALRLRLATRNPYVLRRIAGGFELAVLPPGLEGKVIMLDPGHGGPDTGAVARNGLTEKAFTLAVANHLKHRLEQAGATVLLTRDSDRQAAPEEVTRQAHPSDRVRAELDWRVQMANRERVDLFLSIHANAGPPGEQGTETYWSEDNLSGERSRALAGLVQRELVAALGRPDRGVKTDLFYVTRYVEAPAVLAEVAFLSDPTEAALLADPATQEQAAAALYRAIEQFFAGR